ncbi:MAG: hypothetical protein OGM78_08135 [Oscillospiraceae bacterium]|nr:MAG: hypothetical protein OGM78_08135 [Oscillospiraceae bacterium]
MEAGGADGRENADGEEVDGARQITEILDGGALITEDGVEFELYGGKV